MATTNTLTGLIPTIYTALHEVSRENIGFIPNVSRNSKASGAAVGQTVEAPIAGTAALEDIVAGQEPANSGGATHTKSSVTMTKAKAYPIVWNGEEQLAMGPSGQYNTLLADEFSEGFRAISNAVESDLGDLYKKVARSYGIEGTTPFGTANNHTDFAQSNKMLDDLGAPAQGRIMVLGSAARANVEGIQTGLFHVNEAGDNGAMLRNRQQRQLHNFTMGYSAGIKSHTAGAGASYLLNGALAAGDTTITVDTGSGTILAGDVVTIGGINHVAVTALSAGVFTIASPGVPAIVADDEAITVNTTDYTANMVFHKNALLLATRAPAMPQGGDKADDVMSVTDPVSGLTFQVAIYKGYKQVKYEIGLVWGVEAPNAKHAGILAG